MAVATFTSYLVWDLVTARVLWGCVVRAIQDGDYEVAAYFAHLLADLASA
jgi:hypothetical protein